MKTFDIKQLLYINSNNGCIYSQQATAVVYPARFQLVASALKLIKKVSLNVIIHSSLRIVINYSFLAIIAFITAFRNTKPIAETI